MTLVLEYDTPTIHERETLFSRAIQRRLESGVLPAAPEPQRVAEIMREHPLSAGYFDQALQLARALASNEPELSIERALQESIRTTLRGSETLHSVTTTEPRFGLSQVQLNPPERDEVLRLISFARGQFEELRRHGPMRFLFLSIMLRCWLGATS